MLEVRVCCPAGLGTKSSRHLSTQSWMNLISYAGRDAHFPDDDDDAHTRPYISVTYILNWRRLPDGRSFHKPAGQKDETFPLQLGVPPCVAC